ncbi:uncharacterized protein LDX57_012312 [Aspergillus melleus]|uniref:uncharacterized protein n=1 Tax=Aspergillus melleus TaxID=138277 RepID=UPI001E8D370E|nr:uncharacterized protein LDX57_012312 [Aspergillus melleus]KAH8434672.1 hypothetical protein LDX57_012312 [Aspergillus melleus]
MYSKVNLSYLDLNLKRRVLWQIMGNSFHCLERKRSIRSSYLMNWDRLMRHWFRVHPNWNPVFLFSFLFDIPSSSQLPLLSTLQRGKGQSPSGWMYLIDLSHRLLTVGLSRKHQAGSNNHPPTHYSR